MRNFHLPSHLNQSLPVYNARSLCSLSQTDFVEVSHVMNVAKYQPTNTTFVSKATYAATLAWNFN